MKHSAKIFQDKMMEHARVTVVVDKMPDYPEIINLTETF
jgi:hypothetical protein